MSWKRYAAERTIASACWLSIVIVLVFVMYRVVASFSSQAVAARFPPEQGERVLDYFSSDLGDFIGQLASGSLGESFTGTGSVNDIVVTAAPVTIGLVLGTIVLALAVGVPVGRMWAGHRFRGVSLIGHLSLALLPVWFGLELSYYVGFRWDLTPVAGYCDLFSPPAAAQCGGPFDWARHLQLPWVMLGLPLAALYARVVRALADDVRKAVGAARVEERHEVRAKRRRAAVVAMVRHVSRDFGVLLGLAVFVETVFGLPGLGISLIEYSIIGFDYPMGEGILLAAAALAIAVQLAVDLALAAVVREARLA